VGCFCLLSMPRLCWYCYYLYSNFIYFLYAIYCRCHECRSVISFCPGRNSINHLWHSSHLQQIIIMVIESTQDAAFVDYSWDISKTWKASLCQPSAVIAREVVECIICSILLLSDKKTNSGCSRVVNGAFRFGLPQPEYWAYSPTLLYCIQNLSALTTY